MNNRIKHALIAGTLALGAVAVGAGPALAASPPPSNLNATVTVAPTLSLAITPNAITFNNSVPGGGFQPSDQTVAITVGGNEAWQLDWTPVTLGEKFTATGGASFPVAGNMQFQGQTTDSGSTAFIPGSWSDADQMVKVDADANPSTHHDVFGYQLQLPNNQAAGSYTAAFQYMVAGGS